MARLLGFALLALVAVAAAENVVVLTEDNFQTTLDENEFVLVEFFAPWCGHCKKLAPEYEKAAAKLKEDGIVLGSVDATIEKDLAGRFGVKGYPTLKLFKSGKATEYKGGRTEDTIVNYIRKATGPPAKALESQADLDAFVEGSKVVVVGFFSAASGALHDAFIEAAKLDDDNSFGIVLDAAVAADEARDSVVVFKKFDEGKNVYEGDANMPDVAKFIADNTVPLVIPFSMEQVKPIFQSSTGVVPFLFTDAETPEWYSEIAKTYKGRATFATADSSEGRLNGHVGLTKADFPTFMILETKSQQMKKFRLEGDVTQEGVADLIDQYFAGTAKATFKSEEIPASNDGPVTVVVGKNFDDVVLSGKNVLLEIYAPWCGHCKKLEPDYLKLGEHYASDSNVVIAKMDGTANEVDGLAARGFPTIKFFPAGSKSAASAKDYSGGRSVDEFVKYIDANSVVRDEL